MEYEGAGVYDDLGNRVCDLKMTDMMSLLELNGYNQVRNKHEFVNLMEDDIPEDDDA